MFFRKKSKQFESMETSSKKEEFNTYGLSDVLHYIKREIGVDLFLKKNIVENKLKLFCEDNDICSFKKLHEKILYDELIRQDLVNLLTVNETYFYREEKQLNEAVDFAMQQNGKVDILCAPCASGEEVYSLFMMLNEHIKSGLKSYSITGIDINTEAIKKANQGVFSQRSLHKLNTNLKNKYFELDNNMYRARNHLFHSVRFSKVNIFENSFLNMGSFDIVFSRNMLIYFDETFRLEAVKKFHKLLKNDGRMYLGHADIVPKNEFFVKHGFGSGCYYTKT